MQTNKQLTKFTPGPWSFYERDNKDSSIPYAVIIPYQRSCLPIADVTNQNEVEVCGNPIKEQREANAKLIAAAPTMYEYISKKADEGDVDAINLIKQIS